MTQDNIELLAVLRKIRACSGEAAAQLVLEYFIATNALHKARTLAAQQAEDEALWVQAQTATEAYLQNALRELAAAVEG